MEEALGFRGVKGDLSELGRHLLDLASFLSPILAAGPPPPAFLAGFISDLAEIGSGLRSDLSRAIGCFLGLGPRGRGGRDLSLVNTIVALEVRDLVCENLVKCPKSWHFENDLTCMTVMDCRKEDLLWKIVDTLYHTERDAD